MAKRQTPQDPVTDLVPAEQTDLQFIESVAASVSTWFRGLPDFFKKADAIDKAAAGVLADAKKAAPPKTAEEDEALQKRIQRCNQGKAVAELHWDGTKDAPGITALFHRLHRRSTSRRDKSIKALDEAAGIYNRQHNDFVREATRKAEAERLRLQAIADRDAEEKRQAALDELEAMAIKGEAASDSLSDREKVFVENVVRGVGAAAAANRAGYRDHEARAKLLMASKKIQRAIAGLQEAAALRQQLSSVAAAPIERTVVDVAPDVIKAAGTQSRTNVSVVIHNAQAFIGAAISGKFGIPIEALCIDESRLRKFAKDLPAETVNRWPGIEVVETDKVV
jgi:hypothetical protein